MNAIVNRTIEPGSIDVEQAALGAALIYPQAMSMVASLDDSFFAEPLHQAIHVEMARAGSSGEGISTPQLIARLRPRVPEDFALAPYLSSLMSEAAAPLHALPGLLSALRDRAARRKATEAAAVMSAALSAEDAPIDQAVMAAIEELDQAVAMTRERRRTLFDARRATDAALEGMRDAKARGHGMIGLPSGLRDLDQVTGGFARGEMTVLGGRPSMGKTLAAASMVRQSAHRGAAWAFFSLEMGAAAIALRWMADETYNSGAGITYDAARKGRLSDPETDRMERAGERIAALPIVLEEQPGLTVSEIAARARRIDRDFRARGMRLDGIVVDHMGHVRASKRYAGDKVNETGEVSLGLKALAKDLDIAMLALCQLSRESQKRDDPRPHLADLRNSGDIEQDADCVMFVHREAYYLQHKKGKDGDAETKRLDRLIEVQNVMELIVAKQRNGPTRTVEVFVDLGSNALRDLMR